MYWYIWHKKQGTYGTKAHTIQKAHIAQKAHGTHVAQKAHRTCMAHMAQKTHTGRFFLTRQWEWELQRGPQIPPLNFFRLLVGRWGSFNICTYRPTFQGGEGLPCR